MKVSNLLIITCDNKSIYSSHLVIMNGSEIFYSAITDVSSRLRLDSEDPRWSQLFRSTSFILTLNGSEERFNHFCGRLLENNSNTGNLLQLIEQTASRLKLLSSKNAKPHSHRYKYYLQFQKSIITYHI